MRRSRRSSAEPSHAHVRLSSVRPGSLRRSRPTGFTVSPARASSPHSAVPTKRHPASATASLCRRVKPAALAALCATGCRSSSALLQCSRLLSTQTTGFVPARRLRTWNAPAGSARQTLPGHSRTSNSGSTNAKASGSMTASRRRSDRTQSRAIVSADDPCRRHGWHHQHMAAIRCTDRWHGGRAPSLHGSAVAQRTREGRGGDFVHFERDPHAPFALCGSLRTRDRRSVRG